MNDKTLYEDASDGIHETPEFLYHTVPSLQGYLILHKLPRSLRIEQMHQDHLDFDLDDGSSRAGKRSCQMVRYKPSR